jgi:hypothetical protein
MADIQLSKQEEAVLCGMGNPWATSKDICPLQGADAKQARFLVSKGLAILFADAGLGRWYFKRTQAGQTYCRQLVGLEPTGAQFFNAKEAPISPADELANEVLQCLSDFRQGVTTAERYDKLEQALYRYQGQKG